MTTNYTVKHLSFGMEKILAIGCSSHNTEKTTSNDVTAFSASYLNSNYGFRDLFDNYSNVSYAHHLDVHPVTSFTNRLENIFGNSSTVIRPSPVRPTAKESITAAATPNQFANNNGRRRSWSRAVFSSLQRKGLEKRFAIQKYITKPDRRQLAATLGLTDAQVKVWFQNRRMKWRHTKESERITKIADEGSSKKNNSHTSTFITADEKTKFSDDEDVDVESDVL